MRRFLNEQKMRFMAPVLCLVLVAAAFAVDGSARAGREALAAETVQTATPGDAEGLQKADDGYYYYYSDGEMLTVKGWTVIDDTLAVKLDGKYRVKYKVTTSKSKKVVKEFDAEKGKFVSFAKKTIRLADDKRYYAGAGGVVVCTRKNVSDGSGNTFVLGEGGVVEAKLVKKGSAIKYYTYDSDWDKYMLEKDEYRTVGGTLYYFSPSSGTATRKYIEESGKLYIYKSSGFCLLRSGISAVRSKRLYYFGADGARVSEEGWHRISNGTMVYVGSGGYVTKKLEAGGSHIRKYNYSSLKWENVKTSGWQVIDDSLTVKTGKGGAVQYRLEISGGKTTVKKYDTASRAFVKYTRRTIKLADGRLHYTGRNGVVVTSKMNVSDGSGNTYILGKGGVVTAKLVKKGSVRRFYTYDAGTGKWSISKNKYKTIGDVLYFFSAKSGTAVRMYNNKTKKLYKYKDSKMALVRKDISRVRSSRIYYFNAKGVKVSAEGWYTTAGGTRVRVNKKGYVTAKLTNSSGKRRYYTYSYLESKWKMKKSAWVTIGSKKYYFASNGVAKYIRNVKTGNLMIFEGGSFASANNRIVKSNGRMYYYGSSGKRVTKAGWYMQSSGELVYVGSKGYVTKKISLVSGVLKKYNYSTKKWKSVKLSACRVAGVKYHFDSILTRNPCYTTGEKITVKGLMLHSVGEPQASAMRYVRSWNSEYYSRACVHGFIDSYTGDVYQTLPWNQRGWHCGAAGNNTHIGVEMCEPDCITYTEGSTFVCSDTKRAKSMTARTYKSAVNLFASLCVIYDLDPLEDGVIISHNEGNARGIASGHVDPEHLWDQLGTGYTMDKFRSDVAAKVKKLKTKGIKVSVAVAASSK